MEHCKQENCKKPVHYDGLCEYHDYIKSSMDEYLEWYYSEKIEHKKKWCPVVYCPNRYKKTEETKKDEKNMEDSKNREETKK